MNFSGSGAFIFGAEARLNKPPNPLQMGNSMGTSFSEIEQTGGSFSEIEQTGGNFSEIANDENNGPSRP